MSLGKISLMACAALTVAAPAEAQEASGDAPPAIPVPVDGAERYTPTDFTRFAPVSYTHLTLPTSDLV